MSAYIDSLKNSALNLALKNTYDPARPLETSDATLFAIWRDAVLEFLHRTGKTVDKRRFEQLGEQDQRTYFADASATSFARFVALFRRSARRGIVLQ